jgi:hypothetical protein
VVAGPARADDGSARERASGRRHRERVGVADVELGMRREHAVGEKLTEHVVGPSVHNATNDLVQIGARIDVVSNARRDNRENVSGALSAVVEPSEEPILSPMRTSA